MYNQGSYLIHYGIKGQKKGVRRFQNEDGTLTEEGKERYLKGLSKDRKQAYEQLGPEGKRYVDRELANGNTFDNALKGLLNQAGGTVRKAAIKSTAANYLSGVGLKFAGNLISAKHPVVGRFLKSFGTGMKVGSIIGGTASVGASFMMDSKIKNMSMDEVRESFGIKNKTKKG